MTINTISPKFSIPSSNHFHCVLERAPQGAPQGVLHLIRYRFPRHSSSWSFQSAFHNRKNDARGGKKEHAGYTPSTRCVINGVLRRRSRKVARVRKTNFQINGGRSSLIASSGPGWASYGRPQRL